MWGLPQRQNARRADKIRLCGHLRRYKKIVKKTYIIFLQITYTSHSIKNSLYFPRFFLLPSFFHDYIHLFFILNLSCILLNSSKIVNILHLTKCIHAHFCKHPQKKMKRVWFPTTLFILISSFFTYKKCLSPFYNTWNSGFSSPYTPQSTTPPSTIARHKSPENITINGRQIWPHSWNGWSR